MGYVLCGVIHCFSVCCVGVGGKGVYRVSTQILDMDIYLRYRIQISLSNGQLTHNTTQQLDLTTMVGIFDLGPAVLMFYWDTISRTIVYDQIYKEGIPLYGMGIKRYTTVWSDRRPMKD